MKKTSVLGILVLIFSLLMATPLTLHKEIKATDEETLTIYPQPHALEMLSGTTNLPDVVNVVQGNQVDEVTMKRINEMLTSLNIQVTKSTTKVADKFNIILEVNSDNNLSSELLAKHSLTLDTTKIDAHLVVIDDNSIAVVGKDTDSVFYGVTSLKHIIAQKQKALPNLIIKDYANTKIRGFIEGYYGIPWSNEDRMSLMRFGGEFKANAYIFAPKDDPYHSKKWRELYPANEIEQIKEMASVGNETKTRFVWTIHPFMGEIRFNTNDFEGEMTHLINKFNQLYDAGIRQFGVLGDDVGSLNLTVVVNMMKRLSQWAIDKGDVKDLVFCPASYNSAWAWNANELNTYQAGFPENIHLFWTGSTTCAPITQDTINTFKTRSNGGVERRDPLFWLNWPVNDVDMTRVFMGPGEMLERGVRNLAGAVTNPMQEAEASKVAIFALADYTWNTEMFNAQKSWVDSFPYIDKEASSELHTLAKHMSDAHPGGIRLSESEDIASLLNTIKTAVREGNLTGAAEEEQLQSELATIAQAADGFMKKTLNENLKEELRPFVLALKERVLTIQALLKTQKEVEANNVAKVWENYAQALEHNELATNYPHKKLSGSVMAKPAAKRIQPFFEAINTVIGSRVNELLGFNSMPSDSDSNEVTVITNPRLGVYNSNDSRLEHVNDRNDNTYTWFDFGGKNAYEIGTYIGLDLGSSKPLKNIHVTMGNNNGDIWSKYQIKVSNDQVSWRDVSGEITQSINKQTTDINVADQNIEARYVAIFNLERSVKWVQISELNVDLIQKDELSGFTNVEGYKNIKTMIVDSVAELPATENITLKPNEYIGVDLTKIKDVMTIENESNENLTVESSMNGLEWNSDNPAQTAQYVRLINKTDAPITFNLTKFKVTSFDILPKKVVSSTYNSSKLDNALGALDGDLVSAAWYKESQVAGKEVIYDLGQTITLTDLKMYVNEGEHDYIRHGIVAVSEDNETWNTVLTIGNQDAANNGGNDGAIDSLYPNLEVPYRYAQGSDFSHQVRFIKVKLTHDKVGDDKWTKFQELVLNNGEVLREVNNPAIETTSKLIRGFDKEKTVDNKLGTAFKATEAGNLVYHVRKIDKKPVSLKLYKDNNPVKVEVRTLTGWEVVTTASSEYTDLDLSDKNILDVRLSWENTARINEVVFEYSEDSTKLLVDNPTKITVLINEGSLLSKTISLKVTNEDKEAIVSNVSDESERTKLMMKIEGKDITAYDVSLLENNAVIKVNEPITIQLPVKDKDTYEKVIHIHDGTVVEYEGKLIKDGTAVEIKATGLSPFMVVYRTAEVTPEEPTPEEPTPEVPMPEAPAPKMLTPKGEDQEKIIENMPKVTENKVMENKKKSVGVETSDSTNQTIIILGLIAIAGLVASSMVMKRK